MRQGLVQVGRSLVWLTASFFPSVARSGVYTAVVDPFLSHPYFPLPRPKSHPHIVYTNLSPCCLLVLLLQQTSLGLDQCLCSGLCVPRWQCVRVQRDTEGLGRPVGFQVLLWCLAALCLCLTKPSPPHWVCTLVSHPAFLHSLENLL